jgi:hypothetical protein
MSPAERLARQARSRGASVDGAGGQLLTVPPRSDTDLLDAVVDHRTAEFLKSHPDVAVRPKERPARRGEMGTAWYHCLLYPLRAWPLVAGLALGLSILSIVALFFLWPVLTEVEFGPGAILAWGAFGLAALTLVGYTLAFLDCVLVSSAAGEVRHVHWPGREAGILVRAIVVWLVCLAAGPIIAAAAGWWFWLDCGDPKLLDTLILGELGTVAAGYWLLAIVSVGQSGLLRDAAPFRVADVIERYGWRFVAFAFLAAVGAVMHLYWITAAIFDFPRTPVRSVVVLTGCWLSLLYWATFVMRYVGLWCHRIKSTSS